MTSLSWQKSKARHIIDPGRESTTIILLSEKKILNQLLLIYHHRHRSRHLSSFIKEASVWSRWLLTQRTTTGQCTENETKGCFYLNGTYILYHLLQRLRVYWGRGGRSNLWPKDDGWLYGNGIFWTDKDSCTQEHTAGMTACKQQQQPLQTISRQNPMEREIEHRISPLPKELLITVNWW